MKKSGNMMIGRHSIGSDSPVYIIAEMSANHGQDYVEAVKIIHAIKETGADAVKIQTYTPDTITIDSDSPEFIHSSDSLWAGRKLYDLYKEAYTPWHWQPKLKLEAERLGLDFFSTPFDPTAVKFLESLEVPAYKIASFELVDIPLIRMVARTGKPLIMSTGMASIDEIQEAVDAFRAEGNEQLALLKCTSAYPADPADMHLRTIEDMKQRFSLEVGLSDHTMGMAVPVAAVALGARIIEKHFTLDRTVPGPDSAFSMEPREFKEMVEAVRVVERALGTVHYDASANESESKIFRRSLFVVRDVNAGELFTPENVRSIRPGSGLPPKHLPEIIGRRAAVSVAKGTPLSWAMLTH